MPKPPIGRGALGPRADMLQLEPEVPPTPKVSIAKRQNLHACLPHERRSAKNYTVANGWDGDISAITTEVCGTAPTDTASSEKVCSHKPAIDILMYYQVDKT